MRIVLEGRKNNNNVVEKPKTLEMEMIVDLVQRQQQHWKNRIFEKMIFLQKILLLSSSLSGSF